MRVRLHVTNGEKRSTLDFSKPPIRIGRDVSNECRLEFPFVSRTHALLELRYERLLLIDCGSSAGTWTGGDPGARLTPGDPVELETIDSTFRIGPLLIVVEAPLQPEARVETMLAPESSEAGSVGHVAAPRFETLTAPSLSLPPERVSVLAEPRMLSGYGGAVGQLPALSDLHQAFERPAPVPQAPQAPAPPAAPAQEPQELLKVLEELDPERIERETKDAAGRSPLRFRALWEEYVRRYAEVVGRGR
jgi:predicted component of type VI protein secretion system